MNLVGSKRKCEDVLGNNPRPTTKVRVGDSQEVAERVTAAAMSQQETAQRERELQALQQQNQALQQQNQELQQQNQTFQQQNQALQVQIQQLPPGTLLAINAAHQQQTAPLTNQVNNLQRDFTKLSSGHKNLYGSSRVVFGFAAVAVVVAIAAPLIFPAAGAGAATGGIGGAATCLSSVAGACGAIANTIL